MSKTVRYFTGQDGETVPGVPARNLTEDEYDALRDWQKASVDADASPWRKTKPPEEKPARAKADEQPASE